MKKIFAAGIFLSLSSFIVWSFFGSDNMNQKFSKIKRTIASREVKELDSKISKKIKKISHLHSCFSSRNCGFSKGDSRSYDLDLGKAIKRELEELYEEVVDREVVSAKISSLGREFLKSSDGHIKEAALMLLSTQEPSSDNLNTILEEAISFHSAPLAELAIIELSKYKKEEWQESIDQSFLSNLKTGSVIVRQTLAKNISKFLNEANESKYKDFIENESNDSKIKKYIAASLESE
jgi:hypothetical protein